MLCPLLGNSVYTVVSQLRTSMFKFKIIPVHNFIPMVQDSEGLNMAYTHMNLLLKIIMKIVIEIDISFISSPDRSISKGR